jgi:hypothetical protein
VLIIFSAAPGKQALDGDGDNSPFAAALTKRMIEPGLALQLLGNVVRDDVIAVTESAQRPFISASVTGQLVYLVEKPRPPGGGLGGLGGIAAKKASTPAKLPPDAIELASLTPQGGTIRNRALRSLLALNVVNPGDSGEGCIRDFRGRFDDGATYQRAGVNTCPPSAPDQQFVARYARLPMAQVSVTRRTIGTMYEYAVSGTYPTTKRDGTAAPQGNIIRFAPRRMVGNRPVLLKKGGALQDWGLVARRALRDPLSHRAGDR